MIDDNAAPADETPATAALEPRTEDAPRTEGLRAEATPEPEATTEESRTEAAAEMTAGSDATAATPAPPPAEELIETAAAREERAEEHAAPMERPPAEEAPMAALPPHDPAAEESTVPATPEVAGEPAEPKAAAPKKAKKAKKVDEPAATADVAADETTADALSTAVADEAPTAEGGEEAAAPAEEPPPENKKRWYAVKIQSGREESIKAAIERKVKIEGLEEFFGQIAIPVEEVIVKKKVKVKNKKTGETTTQEKNVTKYNKKFPGYLFAEVEFNNEILYVFRETSGVGDFVGVNTKKTQGAMERQPPSPMTDDEVKSMLTGAPGPTKGGKGRGGKVVVKLDVEKGDKVRIRNGAFAGSEGEVKVITEAKDPADTPKVTVVVTLWGRPVEVELDYWEVDKV